MCIRDRPKEVFEREQKDRGFGDFRKWMGGGDPAVVPRFEGADWIGFGMVCSIASDFVFDD